MANEYHETGLSEEAKDFHRAAKSLIEEIEAVDWYNQRADVTQDEELKAVLLHNRDEEVEHASMLLEWLRRKNTIFDTQLKTYLFTTAPITEIEEHEEGGGEESSNKSSPGSLGIGNMK